MTRRPTAEDVAVLRKMKEAGASDDALFLAALAQDDWPFETVPPDKRIQYGQVRAAVRALTLDSTGVA